MQSVSNKQSEQGFTLVELSIVLVIIGLILGGILVGQNMIRAAELRATISQIEKYSAAVNTFRGKYNGIPGDTNRATRFFNYAGAANGDGDGLLEDGNGAILLITGEMAHFWIQLGAADMIDGNFSLCAAANPTLATHFPEAKNGKGGIVAYTQGSLNHFHIGVQTPATAVATCALSTAYNDALKPEDAFTIDQKLDDGVATTGQVVDVYNNAGTITVGTAAADAACLSTIGGVDDYTLTGTQADACQLRIRM
jgi:prepilin-type N-terminal cleavage/methylation domain-containing protein